MPSLRTPPAFHNHGSHMLLDHKAYFNLQSPMFTHPHTPCQTFSLLSTCTLPVTSDFECPQFLAICQYSTLIYLRVCTHALFFCHPLRILIIPEYLCLHKSPVLDPNPTQSWDLERWGDGALIRRVMGKLPASLLYVRRQIENSCLQIQKTAHTWPQPWWHADLELPRPGNCEK